MGCLRQVFTTAVIVAASCVAHADEARLVYYDVAGHGANALRQQLDASGPPDGHGRRYDAVTHWNVAWTYHYLPTETGCRFTDIQTSIEGTITLPRWTDGDSASNRLRKKWQTYLAALRVHEDGHYSHGVGAAREVEDLGRSYHVAGTCSAIGRTFNDLAGSIVEKYKAMDVAYDHDTNHGQTQGARFP